MRRLQARGPVVVVSGHDPTTSPGVLDLTLRLLEEAATDPSN